MCAPADHTLGTADGTWRKARAGSWAYTAGRGRQASSCFFQGLGPLTCPVGTITVVSPGVWPEGSPSGNVSAQWRAGARQLQGALRTLPATDRGRGSGVLAACHPTAPLQSLMRCPGHSRRLVAMCRMNREGQASRNCPCPTTH